MNLSEKINNIILGKTSNEVSLEFYKNYHKNFRDSGIHKGKTVLNQLNSLRNIPNLERLAYVSLGGSEGSELDYILRNSEIKVGILMELDTHACEIANEKLSSLPDDKKYQIIPGDLTQQTKTLHSILNKFKEAGDIEGVLIVANSVFHELSLRSLKFDINSLIGELFWDWDPCIFICREPCKPFNWPERVEFSVRGLSSDLLYDFTQEVKSQLSFSDEIMRCGPKFVSTSSILATEVIHKLFYIDDFNYEIKERLTSLDPDNFVRLIEQQLGKNSVFQVRLNSSSFSRKYQELDIEARNSDGVILPMPLTFFSILASKTT